MSYSLEKAREVFGSKLLGEEINKLMDCRLNVPVPVRLTTGEPKTPRHVVIFYKENRDFLEISKVYSEGLLSNEILVFLKDLSFIGTYEEFRNYIARVFPVSKYRHIAKLTEENQDTKVDDFVVDYLMFLNCYRYDFT